jgi:hypothetical protein
MKAVADLSHPLQRMPLREIQFRRVVKDQHNFFGGQLSDLSSRSLLVRTKDAGVCNLVCFHQSIERLEILGTAHLARQAAAGMLYESISDLNQPPRSPKIAQSSLTKVLLAETSVHTVQPVHAPPP